MSTLDRREFLASVAAGVTAAPFVPGLVAESDAQTRPAGGGLAPLAFSPLPLGAIRPAGWLQRQMRIQADGLSGHLDEFWPDVAQSQWFGGTAEGWERAPYWLDGAIPLAWILDDAPMKARITKYIDTIVTRQRADGWYGPYPEDAVAKRYDMWAILLANKVMVQYHDATGDPRALTAVMKSLKALVAGLDRTPLYNWGRCRWYEGLVPASSPTSARASRGCSTSPENSAHRERTTKRSSPPTISEFRRRGAACGNGPNTSSTRAWPPRHRPSAGASIVSRPTRPGPRA